MTNTEDGSLVTLVVDGDVATISLNRPEVRNALNRQLMVDVIAIAEAVADREDIRAVVFSAEGSDFSVGADLERGLGHGADRLAIARPSRCRTGT